MILRVVLSIFITICALVITVRTQDFVMEPDGIDAEKEEESKFNNTYVETASALETYIFKNYNRARRPVRNASRTIEVLVHLHILHISVDQVEQTLSVQGHIYTSWTDEYLGWKMSDYSTRVINAKKWQVWNPTLKIANTVSGVASSFEISRSAHALIYMVNEESAKVEVYPSFSVKVGCNFDYSNFPNDEQECAIRLFAVERMNEVQLKFFEGHAPTISLGWGHQGNKSVVSDYEVIDKDIHIEYYLGGKYTKQEPATAEELARTWSVLVATFRLRRFSPIFGIAFILPCVVSALLIIGPYFVPKVQHAVYVLVANVVLQVVFIQEMILGAPSSTRRMPRCFVFYGVLLMLNGASLLLHIVLFIVSRRTTAPPSFIQPITGVVWKWLRCGLTKPQKSEAIDWKTVVASLRTIIGLFMIFLFVLLFLIFFLG